MGAWGNGPFDNDDAADFAGLLSEMTDAGVVAAVLGDALLAVSARDGFLEAPNVSRAVAAAAIVALLAAANAPTPASVGRSWSQSVGLMPSQVLRAEAAQVFLRAFEPEDNEWYELWSDAGLIDDVRAAMTPYSQALP